MTEQVDVYSVVKKLIGPIIPVGDTCEDDKRLENLKQLMDVVSHLLTDIDDVAFNADSPFHSCRQAGQHAKQCLANWGEPKDVD